MTEEAPRKARSPFIGIAMGVGLGALLAFGIPATRDYIAEQNAERVQATIDAVVTGNAEPMSIAGGKGTTQALVGTEYALEHGDWKTVYAGMVAGNIDSELQENIRQRFYYRNIYPRLSRDDDDKSVYAIFSAQFPTPAEAAAALPVSPAPAPSPEQPHSTTK